MSEKYILCGIQSSKNLYSAPLRLLQNAPQPGQSIKGAQWRIQGGTSGHGPPLKLTMEFAPLGGRKSNDSIVNLSKYKDFGLRRINVGYGFAPLPTEKYHIKT